MVGFCSSPRFVEHDTGKHHPERPDRIRAIFSALHQAGYIAANPFLDFKLELGALPRAKRPLVELAFEAADPTPILAVHPQQHVDMIRHICDVGYGVLDQGDTPVGEDSYEVALLGIGAILRGCDAVMGGEVRRVFCAVRPPGHHAEPNRAMGFCLFSNIAIGARYLQQRHGVRKVAIVDFDVHHGNGTQACFDKDSTVFFVSLHQHPVTCYPGTGFEWETGTGPGRGFTLNIPFDPGAGDVEYVQVMSSRVVPEVERFEPEVLMVSAGFDAHQADPLASINLSEEGFEMITRALVGVADRCCGGRIISVLEGGYSLRALGRSVVRHVSAMME
jgi:acetoin utilization deacetylase AcuC-like enzyme